MASGINFSGLSSGLDTKLIIESLLTNQTRRAESISKMIDDGDAKKRALSDVKSAVSRFDTLLGDLGEAAFGNRKVTSGDEALFTATADEDSALGDHEIKVNNLASRSVATVGQAQSSASAVIGAGTLDLKFNNSADLSVTLSSATSTLSDLSNAINAQHGDTVQSSIVEVSSGSFQLVLSSKLTGADLNLKAEADGAGSSAISGFDTTFLDAAATNSGGITRTQDGEDSQIVLDGITINRSTNTLDDVLAGVTLTLKSESTSTSPTSLKVDSNFDDITTKIDEFTKSYNDVLSQIDRVTNSDTGTLKNDPDLKALRSSLQAQITRLVPNVSTFNVRDGGETGFTSLSQLGFKSDSKTGSLSFDKAKFKTNLKDHFEEVQNIFVGKSTTDNNDITMLKNSDKPFGGSISIDSVNNKATIGGQSYDLTRSGNLLTLGSGDYKGLSFLDGSGGIGTANLEISGGIGAILKSETTRYSSFSGILSDRMSNIDTHKRALEKQFDAAGARLENQKNRLTSVFAKAEQSISTLQGLQSSLSAQGK